MTPSPEPSRRLAAVWFADIVGYTSLSQTDEDEVYRAVFQVDPDFNLSAHLERVREVHGLTVFADDMLDHFREVGPSGSNSRMEG